MPYLPRIMERLNENPLLLDAAYNACNICPRRCGINRNAGHKGFCRTGCGLEVAWAGVHGGEEPCLAGASGVGNFFFSGCNMACVYCQNHQISQGDVARLSMSEEAFVQKALFFQEQSVRAIGLVSGGHQAPALCLALAAARRKGLEIPVIYNTNAYETVESLKTLEGLVDIYLPDIRYSCDDAALKYSMAPGYTEISRNAILEMYRQVGPVSPDPATGLVDRGLWVRHLVLPNSLAGTWESLCFLALELSPRIGLSVMSQYNPLHRAGGFEEIARTITQKEYEQAVDMAVSLGFENILTQEIDGAAHNAVPDFSDPALPFKSF